MAKKQVSCGRQEVCPVCSRNGLCLTSVCSAFIWTHVCFWPLYCYHMFKSLSVTSCDELPPFGNCCQSVYCDISLGNRRLHVCQFHTCLSSVDPCHVSCQKSSFQTEVSCPRLIQLPFLQKMLHAFDHLHYSSFLWTVAFGHGVHCFFSSLKCCYSPTY